MIPAARGAEAEVPEIQKIYTVCREFLDTTIIYIIQSCMSASESYNTAMERQFCELSEYVRILKLGLLIKRTDRFKQELPNLVHAELGKTTYIKFTILIQSL